MSDMRVTVGEVSSSRTQLVERYIIHIAAKSDRMPDPLHLHTDNLETGEKALPPVSADALPQHVRDALYLWLASIEVTAS
ncbi:MAG: hypothetical protein WBD41_03895 [Rhodococcus sp. (in: high G+C Gram-positive bacteria)]